MDRATASLIKTSVTVIVLVVPIVIEKLAEKKAEKKRLKEGNIYVLTKKHFTPVN